jgi:chromosome segregation ATPase
MQLVQAAKKTVAAGRLASSAGARASGGQEVEPEVESDEEPEATVVAEPGDLEELKRRLDAQEQGTGEMSEAFSTMKAELLSTREELLECRALLGDVESMEKISSLVEDRNALKELVEEEQGRTKEAAEKNQALEEESSALRADVSKLREQVKAMEFQLGQRQGDASAPDGRDETISMLKDSVAKMHHLLKTLQIEPPDLGDMGAAAPGPSSPGNSGGGAERAASQQEERAVAAAATAAVSNITSVAAAKRKAKSRVRR